MHSLTADSTTMDKPHSSSLKSSFLGSTPHPSSPISAAATSTSPRLASFGRRFKSPSATTAPATTPGDQASVQARNTDAVKSAKRYLLATVRTDWEYDASSFEAQAGPSSPPHLKGVEYRPREDGSSDPGSGPEDMRDPMAWTDGESNPYKYESPDAIAEALTQKKRKRRRVMLEEMKFNEGLKIFQERRNAWTGAVPRERRKRAKETNENMEETDTLSRNDSSTLNFDMEMDNSAQWSQNGTPAQESPASSPETADTENTKIPSESEQPSAGTENRPEVDIDPLLPVAPPLLPLTNPVRAAITPSMYSTIYSKVVLQSLTPSVPIPLPDITRSLVQGWKEEGNWPPKSTIPATTVNPTPALTKERERREGGKRKGMSEALRKALGLKASPYGGHGSGTNTSKDTGRNGSIGGGTAVPPKQDALPPMVLENAEAMFEDQSATR